MSAAWLMSVMMRISASSVGVSSYRMSATMRCSSSVVLAPPLRSGSISSRYFSGLASSSLSVTQVAFST